MIDKKICQVIDCENIGRTVKVVVEVKGEEQIHTIVMCRMHINIQNLMKDGFKN